MVKHATNFERNSRDFYPTPKEAVIPLINYLDKPGIKFIEPFAGDGALIRHIEDLSKHHMLCIYASDIDPQVTAIGNTKHPKGYTTIETHDYTDYGRYPIHELGANCFISNPPWINTAESKFLRTSIIHNLSGLLPTWLLLKGAYAFNENMSSSMAICTDIIPIGRVKWIPGSAYSGTEDCAWFRFDKKARLNDITGPVLHPRRKIK